MTVWVNKVGPYHNPQETYNYFDLPFCKAPKDLQPTHKNGGIGEVLEGNELINSNTAILFKSE
jgi:transmembrane 9 superfamily protein 3